MFTTLRNAWKIPELRKKILFTLIVMLIYRLGNCVPVPYVNVVALNNYFTTQLANTVLGLYNAMSGSAFSQATVYSALHQRLHYHRALDHRDSGSGTSGQGRR